MGGEGLFIHRRQVVHVEEPRTVVGIPPADEQVDVVRRARAQEIGQIFAGVVSRGLRGQIVSVAVLVQLHVLADEFRELRQRREGKSKVKK